VEAKHTIEKKLGGLLFILFHARNHSTTIPPPPGNRDEPGTKKIQTKLAVLKISEVMNT
jgi:hypothetical protein